MYLLRSIILGPKFLSLCVMTKSLFCLSFSNTFSCFLFNLPVGIGLLDLYMVWSSLENFHRRSSTAGNF